jgi:HAD superfamily hydrolase (TIGR01549 family)
MIRTIFFDMGGTLDGDGQHWLERLIVLYRNFGVDLPRETLRGAFDEAERQSARNEEVASANFDRMIELYVTWQLAHLGLKDPALEQYLIAGFVRPVRKAAAANAHFLADLTRRGFELGVVSNGCGNVEVLCADFGYLPFLTVVVDSHRVGIRKPDPAIYLYAAREIGRTPAEILMVGDSFERDVVPAKQIGMTTAWLEGPEPQQCPDLALVDIRLSRLADLPPLLASLPAAAA